MDHPKITAQPRVTLNVALEKRPSKVVEVTSVADTGAQSDLWLLDKYLKAWYRMSDLSPVSISLNAANRLPIRIDDAFHANIKGRSHADELIVCYSMIYISRDVTTMYISYDTMATLGIVNHDFLMVGQFSLSTNPTPSKRPLSISSDMTDDSTGRISGATKIDGQMHQYPKWNAVPDCPTALFSPVQVKIMTKCAIGFLTTMVAQLLTPAPTKHFPKWQDCLLKFILRTR